MSSRARVAIIGAGVVGVVCALRLVREGFDVVVLDEAAEGFRRGGANTSVSAAGMLAPLSEAAAYPSSHPHADALALLSFDFWRDGADASPWSAYVRFDGAIFAAGTDAAASNLLRSAEGRRIAALDAAALRRSIGPSQAKTRAFFVEDEGALDPERVYAAMVTEAKARGIVFQHGFTFDGLGAFSVYDAIGAPVAADHIVIAPGATRDPALLAAAPALKRIRPAKGCLTEIDCGHSIGVTLHAPGFYITRRWNGDHILGASMEWDRADTEPDSARVAELVDAANGFFGGGVSARGTSWAGVRPMSPDGAPLIGPVKTASASAFLAAGHGRNGWLLAPVTAEMICAYVKGEAAPTIWASFLPDRFETEKKP